MLVCFLMRFGAFIVMERSRVTMFPNISFSVQQMKVVQLYEGEQMNQENEQKSSSLDGPSHPNSKACWGHGLVLVHVLQILPNSSHSLLSSIFSVKAVRKEKQELESSFRSSVRCSCSISGCTTAIQETK